MKQIRIYTLKNRQAAEVYFQKHWPRHLLSLPKFGVTVENFYLGVDEHENQVIAVGSYQDGADIATINQQYMNSSEFRDDMEGFNMSDIVRVEEINCIDSDLT